MAKKLKVINRGRLRPEVFLDDVKIEDVLSYETERAFGCTIATLKIRISESAEIHHSNEKISITEEMMEKFRKDAEEWVDRNPKRFKDPELAKKMFVNNRIEKITNPRDPHIFF